MVYREQRGDNSFCLESAKLALFVPSYKVTITFSCLTLEIISYLLNESRGFILIITFMANGRRYYKISYNIDSLSLCILVLRLDNYF